MQRKHVFSYALLLIDHRHQVNVKSIVNYDLIYCDNHIVSQNKLFDCGLKFGSQASAEYKEKRKTQTCKTLFPSLGHRINDERKIMSNNYFFIFPLGSMFFYAQMNAIMNNRRDCVRVRICNDQNNYVLLKCI